MAMRKVAPLGGVIDLKRLRLRDGDVLAIKEDTGLGIDKTMDNRQAIMERLSGAISKSNVLVVFVRQLSDIKALDEKVMRNYGWERIKDAS